MWATVLWDQEMAPLQWGVVLVAAGTGAILDGVWRRIPNGLTAPVLVGGLAWAAWVGGWAGLADSAAACALLAAPYVLLFLWGGGGAGDAKLMGALGAWLGLVSGMVVLASVAAAGVVIGAGWALAQGRFRTVAARVGQVVWQWALWAMTFGRFKPDPAPAASAAGATKMPYGIAILVGVSVAVMGVYLWRTQ